MQPQQPNDQTSAQPSPQLFPPYQGPPVQSGVPVPGQMGQPPEFQPKSSKKKHHWGIIITITLLVLLLIGSLIFGIWSYMKMQDYKTNSDQKSSKAVAIAVQKEDSKKDQEFTEKEKYPLKPYLGPDTYGGINMQYPKTWAAFITQTDGGPTPIDGYFYPNFVPGIQSGTNFAVRLQVTSQTYDQEMKQFESKVRAGKVTVSPIVLKNVPSVTGSRVTGEVKTGQKDVMVLLPLRDKTIKISTESPEFQPDFDNIILPNLKFTP